MRVYFSISRISELQQNYKKIASFFSVKEQSAMSMFLSEVEKNGYCEIELYNNIYSILNRVSIKHKNKEKNKANKNQNVDNEELFEISEGIRVLDLIRLQFATKYYITTTKDDLVNQPTNCLKKN